MADFCWTNLIYIEWKQSDSQHLWANVYVCFCWWLIQSALIKLNSAADWLVSQPISCDVCGQMCSGLCLCVRSGGAARTDWRTAWRGWRTWRPDSTSRCQRATTSCRGPRNPTRYAQTALLTRKWPCWVRNDLIGWVTPEEEESGRCYWGTRCSFRASLTRS